MPDACGGTVLPWLSLLMAGAAALPCRAQDVRFQTLPNGLRWGAFAVPGCKHQAALLFVGAGGLHDPSGLSGLGHLVARLSVAPSLAEERAAEQAPRRRAETPTRGNVLRAQCTLFWSLEPAGAERETLGWFAHLLRDGPEDEDRFDRERIALVTEARQCTEVEPGGVLWWRALAACYGETPAGRPWSGDPNELRRASIEAAQAWHRTGYAPERALLVLVGALTEANALPLLTATLGELPRRDGGALPPSASRPAATSRPLPDQTVSPHVGAPFVTAAFPAPGPQAPEFPAFVVALAALETRVLAAFAAVGRDGMTGFAPRGLELVGNFPPVRCAWLEGDAALCLNRRGRNGQKPEDVRAELEQLLDRVVQDGIGEAEVQAARRVRNLLPEWPPGPALAAQLQHTPRRLYTLAHALGMAEILGLPVGLRAAIDTVPASAVQAYAKSAWAPAAARWLALLPP